MTAASLTLFLVLFLFFGFTEEGLRHNIRWSARISFVLFCLAFGASALRPNSFSWWLRMNRKYLGISFAIVHLLHLGLLIALQYFFHPVFQLAKSSSLLGGGIAYVFLTLMLLTSFDHFAKYLSKKQWKMLHTWGGYWIWAIFMSTYYKRAVTEPWHWIFVVILMAVLFLRIRKLSTT